MDFWEDVVFELLLPLIGGAIVLVGICVVGRQVDHHYQISQCRGFSSSTGYETKFADYNFWQYECLAKTNEGKWIPSDALRGVNQ